MPNQILIFRAGYGALHKTKMSTWKLTFLAPEIAHLLFKESLARFGIIPCERTTRDVLMGEELFLDYEYDPYNCPKWFSEALTSFVHDARIAGTEDADILVGLRKKYARFVEFELNCEV